MFRWLRIDPTARAHSSLVLGLPRSKSKSNVICCTGEKKKKTRLVFEIKYKEIPEKRGVWGGGLKTIFTFGLMVHTQSVALDWRRIPCSRSISFGFPLFVQSAIISKVTAKELKKSFSVAGGSVMDNSSKEGYIQQDLRWTDQEHVRVVHKQ